MIFKRIDWKYLLQLSVLFMCTFWIYDPMYLKSTKPNHYSMGKKTGFSFYRKQTYVWLIQLIKYPCTLIYKIKNNKSNNNNVYIKYNMSNAKTLQIIVFKGNVKYVVKKCPFILCDFM